MSYAEAGPAAMITDGVTGAYHRALLRPRAEAELSRAVGSGGACSLLLFDVDYFKSVNDSYGHQRGDEILAEIAARATTQFRGHAELFRYGGDEFVLLLPECDRADAVRVAMAVVAAMRDVPFAGNPPLRVSVSLGVATYPDDAGDFDSLLACADRRNYLAKGRGRACAVADDAETGAVPTTSRLLDRESAVAAVNDVLTRVETTGVEWLAVTGQPGAGCTRFLAEVGRIAVLRGFRVLDLSAAESGADPEAGQVSADRLVVLVDADAVPQVSAGLDGWRSRVRALVVAYVDTAAAAALPRSEVVVLNPWSPGVTRIWLRSVLAGEPSDVLVDLIQGLSGGLPALCEREMARLGDRRGLLAVEGGGWTVTAAALGRPRRNDLPVPFTDLVGREAERDRVVRLLSRSRLVTLVGPGGVGKTRLCLAAAEAAASGFADGVVFVPLADLDVVDRVVEAVAAAVGAEPGAGEWPLDALVERLVDASMLLVLDNFEQVLDAALPMADLMRRAPRVRLLVTSRERLSLYGEQVYQVPPLPLPIGAPSGGVAVALREYPALALFERRAQAVDADFVVTAAGLGVVAEVCRRLDGLPLAIELAAARIDSWSLELLLDNLADHLAALSEGPRDLQPRQRTLRGAIEWSLNLLTPQDQVLFGRLAAFVGGGAVDAVASVVSADPDAVRVGLAALTDKSLLVRVPGDDSRFAMLETIRSAAVDRLSRDADAEAVLSRHAGWYADLVEQSANSMDGTEAAAWSRLVVREYPNLRAAFDTLMRRGDTTVAARLCFGLWQWWRDGHHLDEGREWCARLMAVPQPLTGVVAAELLYIGSVMAHYQDDHAVAQELAERSLQRYVEAGDRYGTARAHSALGMAAFTRGDYRTALDQHSRSLDEWQAIGSARGVVVGLGNLTKTALRLGDLDAAERYVAGRLALGGTEGARDRLLGLEDRIDIAIGRGDTAAARVLLAESVALSRELDDVAGEAMALHQSGRLDLLAGRPGPAMRSLVEALGRRHALKLHEDVAISLECVADVLAASGPVLAAELLGAAEAVRLRHRLPVPPSQAHIQASATSTARAGAGEHGYVQAYTAGRSAPIEVLTQRVLEAVAVLG
jgi:diguanylate cyclase (GGDEF)-like protein